MVDEINVTNDNLYLYKPNLNPSVENQLLFNEATQNIYKTSYDEHYTERRFMSDIINQVDVGSAQQVNSPKYLIYAHQTQHRINTPNKNINKAKLDNLELRKYYVEIDGQRYPRDISLINYEENDYIEQYKYLNLFFKEYIGETILNLFISYPDMNKIPHWSNRFETSTWSYNT